jgi:AcrR family transcriptional regulator
MERGQKQQTRRERAHQAKRRRIAQAAALLFREHGFDAVTTDQIAAAADIAKGTLFLYAPTKARLLVLVFESELEQAVALGFAALADGLPPVEALCSIFHSLFQVYEHDRDLSQRFVREALFLTPADPPYSTVMDNFFAGLAALIAGWQAAGRITPTADPRLLTQTTFAIYFSVLIGWLGGRIPNTEVRDQVLRAGLVLLLDSKMTGSDGW